MHAPSSRAVFVSDAREDTDAARRIADGIQASGIDVCFDRDVLRGGDAWESRFARSIEFAASRFGLKAKRLAMR